MDPPEGAGSSVLPPEGSFFFGETRGSPPGGILPAAHETAAVTPTLGSPEPLTQPSAHPPLASMGRAGVPVKAGEAAPAGARP
jgi:energy-converting hydrogenase Eha subunit F